MSESESEGRGQVTRLKELVNKRRYLKGKITSLEKSFSDLKPHSSATLNSFSDRLTGIFAKVEDILMEIAALDDGDEHMDEANALETKFFTLDCAIRTELDQINVSRAETSFRHHEDTGESKSTKNFSLPKINIPHYNGDYDEWPRFRNLFENLINQSDLARTQKFYYLRTLLQGEAAGIINNITEDPDNYDDAWKKVMKRYENKPLLASHHLKAIFELQPSKQNNIRNLLNSFNQHYNSLTSLKIDNLAETILIHVLKSKVDYTSMKEFELKRKNNEFLTLQELLDHLESRAQAFEMLDRDTGHKEQPKQWNNRHRHEKSMLGRADTKPTGTSNQSCLHCNQSHNVEKCELFLNLTAEQRTAIAREKKWCFRCLSPHSFYKCKAKSCCSICKRNHHTLLHRTIPYQGTITETTPAPQSDPQDNTTTTLTSCAGKVSSDHNGKAVLLATAMVRIANAQGKFHPARALLDNGSERSFITSDLLRKLNLKAENSNLFINGIGCNATSVDKEVNIKVRSTISEYGFQLHCGVLDAITGDLPSVSFDKNRLRLPPFVTLADPNCSQKGRVDLLIGADQYYHLIKRGFLSLGAEEPHIFNTHLGWVLGGTFQVRQPIISAKCHLIRTVSPDNDLNETLKKFWSLDCIDHAPVSADDKQVEEHYTQNVRRDDEGRYQVSLPIIQDELANLGDSLKLASSSFAALERKFIRNPDFHSQYKNFIKEYLTLNHAKEIDMYHPCPAGPVSASYFMPHRAVIREKASSTRLRVVFNASAPTSTGVSLNDTMLVGPVLQPDLFSVLIRFRSNKIAIICDIEKMYRQINVAPQDCKLQRILWRDSTNEPIKSLELSTVTYGTASASFLATRTLLQLVSDEGDSFPAASEALRSCCYMDDVMAGAEEVHDAVKLRNELTALLRKGKFNLHKWCSSCNEVMDTIPIEKREKCNFILSDTSASLKTLGVVWNPNDDVFLINIPQISIARADTKRKILADIAKIFDPLGLIAPVTTSAKLILKKVWSQKVGWDDKVPHEIISQWERFYQDIISLKDTVFDRKLFIDNSVTCELHGFADSSTLAYGACVYMRSTNASHEHKINLICAKSRVAPHKPVTLPRLELCAALLLAKLINKCKIILSTKNVNVIHCYTDSTITLAWIKSEASRWNMFVANRVGAIQELTNVNQWSHVKSADNPADLISRGVQPHELKLKDIWWLGPKWLSHSANKWPTTAPLEEIKLELRRNVQTCTANVAKAEENSLLSSFGDFSSWIKLQRTVAFVLRFIHNARSKKEDRNLGLLSAKELIKSRMTIVKVVQISKFKEILRSYDNVNKKLDYDIIKSSQIRFLNPFVDSNGALRVGGRIKHSQSPETQRFPLILPEKDHVTELIIRHEHEKLFHAGAQNTLNSVRLTYWPQNGRNIVRRLIRKCVTCFRFRAQGETQIMANLPSVRVTPARPFLNVGVDYAGPVAVKQSRARKPLVTKGYICLFICMSTKAVHLELVSDMTTCEFLHALSRLWYRRGKPVNIYSDNGSTFKGAHNELNNLYKMLNSAESTATITDFMSKEAIQWHYIPPYSPHWGGLWENGVKMVKHHLKRQLGNAILTYDHLYTILVQIEGIVNSRPLGYFCSEPNDVNVLTPAHFLIGEEFTSLPEADLVNTNVNRLSLYQKIVQIKQVFWKRWNKEYLTSLQTRQKWLFPKTDVKINDVVLIKEENAPPLSWPLGRVTNVTIGNDGHVRTVKVKTKNREVSKPITKICLLPIEDNHVRPSQ